MVDVNATQCAGVPRTRSTRSHERRRSHRCGTVAALLCAAAAISACGDGSTGTPAHLPSQEQVAGVEHHIEDVVIRVLPALSDRETAQRVRTELLSVPRMLQFGALSQVSDAIAKSREYLSVYDAADAPAGDAPDVDVIRLALDHVEQIVQSLQR